MDGARARRADPRARWPRRCAELGGIGLATVLVGDDPASTSTSGCKHEAAAEAAIAADRPQAARDDDRRTTLLALRRRAERATTRSTASSSSSRCRSRSTRRGAARDRPGQGRRRLASLQRRPALRSGARRFVPATPLGDAWRCSTSTASQLDGRARGRRRPQRHRRQADGACCCCRRTRRSRSAIRARDDLARHTLDADVLVVSRSACPGIVTPDMVKPGAAVVDVGINAHRGRARRRRRRRTLPKSPRLITPVPGGVGPMTIAMLLAQHGAGRAATAEAACVSAAC